MTKLALAVLVALLLTLHVSQAQAQLDESKAAARELVEASQATKQFQVLLPMVMQQMKPVVAQGRPEVERDYDVVSPIVMEMVRARLDEFAEAAASIYARHFSVDELRQIAAFYKTPAGAKSLEKMPLIAQESMTMGQKFSETLIKDLQDKLREELRKRGHNI